MVMSANAAAAIVREGARRRAKEFHPRCSLCPSLSSPLPPPWDRGAASFCGLGEEKIYEAVFCRSDIGIISVESNGADGRGRRTDDEKAAGTKKEGDSPSLSLAFAPSID